MIKKAVVAILFLSPVFHALTAQRPEGYPIDRAPGQGQLWLGRTKMEKQQFVSGYLRGFELGFKSGCVTYFDVNPPQAFPLDKSPLQKCNMKQLTYSKGVDFYANQITTFYETFPSDTDASLPWLLRAFADSENKTLQDIDAVWARGHASKP